MRRPQPHRVAGLLAGGSGRAGGAQGADQERDRQQPAGHAPSYDRAGGGAGDPRPGMPDTLRGADADPLLTETVPYPLDSGGRIDLPHPAHAGRRPRRAAARLHPRRRPARASVSLEYWVVLTALHLCGGRWPAKSGSPSAVWPGRRYSVGRHFTTGVGGHRGRSRPVAADLVYCDHLSMAEVRRPPWRANRLRRAQRRVPRSCSASPGPGQSADPRRGGGRAAPRAPLPSRRLPAQPPRVRRQRRRPPGPDLFGRPGGALRRGADCRRRRRHHPYRDADTPARLLFLGGLHGRPTPTRWRPSCATCGPQVRVARPDATLTSGGATTVPSPTSAAAPPAAVDCLGARHRPVRAGQRVLVVPMRAGSGMRVKILHAMARGLPVVSTTVGARALASCPGSICSSPTPRRRSPRRYSGCSTTTRWRPRWPELHGRWSSSATTLPRSGPRFFTPLTRSAPTFARSKSASQ